MTHLWSCVTRDHCSTELYQMGGFKEEVREARDILKLDFLLFWKGWIFGVVNCLRVHVQPLKKFQTLNALKHQFQYSGHAQEVNGHKKHFLSLVQQTDKNNFCASMFVWAVLQNWDFSCPNHAWIGGSEFASKIRIIPPKWVGHSIVVGLINMAPARSGLCLQSTEVMWGYLARRLP